MTQSLSDLVAPERLTQVVDVGANPIDGDPPYLPMLEAGLCRVTGFEPQPEALAQLQAKRGGNETYLPLAVGDGQTHTLHQCRATGMTSLLRPDPDQLAAFNDFPRLGEVIDTAQIATVQLDDIDEIGALDFLKIDIQGTELAVFTGGRKKLAHCAVIQTEVSFVPLYENQPVFWEIDRELRSQGFVPHAFAAIKRWPLAPFVSHQDSRQPLNQLLEGDLIYIKNVFTSEPVAPETLKHLALIAHHCFASYDLVLKCLNLLIQQEAIADQSADLYLDQIGNGRPKPVPVPEAQIISFDMDFNLN